MLSDLLNVRKLLLEQYDKLVAATSFLSTIPLPSLRRSAANSAANISPLRGVEYFPLVGLLLCVVLWALIWALSPFLPHLVLAALLVVALLLITGALHLDGLMDSCDGLFGGFTRERRLEIMRDSRVGSFGVLAGVCALLLKFACLASLSTSSWPQVFLLVLPASRWSLVLVLKLFPAARSNGLGQSFRQMVRSRTIVIACTIAVLCALLAAQLSGLTVWCIMTLASLLVGAWMSRKLGGLTGDTYGAIAEVAEIVGLLACLFLHM